MAQAIGVARTLAKLNGTVAAGEVREHMGGIPDSTDPRILGAIFRKGFVRTGFIKSPDPKQHARPIAVWGLA